MENGKRCGSGIGLLVVIFVVFKLTHVIDWSWWWVLSPLWLTAVVAVTAIVLVGIVLFVLSLVDDDE